MLKPPIGKRSQSSHLIVYTSALCSHLPKASEAKRGACESRKG